MLLEMGFDEKLVKTALNITRNNVETAVKLYFILYIQSLVSGNLVVPPAEFEQYKMVIVVRADLKMGIGKIAAQVGHAVLGAYKHALKVNPTKVMHWDENGGAKIVLKVKNEAELKEVAENARKDGISVHMVQDAGKTQVEPGTLTVCGVGPDETSLIDKHTGKLQLL